MTNPARRFGLLAAALLLAPASPAAARTIVISSEDCEQMAFIAAETPKLTWASYQVQPGVYTNQYHLTMARDRALLICFPLDRLPKDQKITKAELVLPVTYLDGEGRLQLRRIVTEWGTGVNYQYRMVRPEKKEWSKPGAADTKLDALMSSSVKLSEQIRTLKETAVNVTEDVELWYSGAAVNHGWRIAAEPDGNPYLYMLSPISCYPDGRGSMKLRITYEPAE